MLPAMTKQRSTRSAGDDDSQVSRPGILQSALEIVDRDGVDGLSMRRLSDEVRRDPTVIYRHVPEQGGWYRWTGRRTLEIACLPTPATEEVCKATAAR